MIDAATGGASRGVDLVESDPQRRPLTKGESIAEHFRTRGTPIGHGFGREAIATGQGHYSVSPAPGMRFLVLDSVNESGGHNGNIDDAQFRWIHDELVRAEERRELVIAFAHHTLATLVERGPAGGTSDRAAIHFGLGADPSRIEPCGIRSAADLPASGRDAAVPVPAPSRARGLRERARAPQPHHGLATGLGRRPSERLLGDHDRVARRVAAAGETHRRLRRRGRRRRHPHIDARPRVTARGDGRAAPIGRGLSRASRAISRSTIPMRASGFPRPPTLPEALPIATRSCGWPLRTRLDRSIPTAPPERGLLARPDGEGTPAPHRTAPTLTAPDHTGPTSTRPRSTATRRTSRIPGPGYSGPCTG